MTWMRQRRVAVLGAGIMGCTTAMRLARAGMPVQVFDAAPVPLNGASRWNEGKIHLGHLYAADPSLETARRVLPGGLVFPVRMKELIGEPLDRAVTRHDDTYLVHRDSVVDAQAMGDYLEQVSRLASEHPDAGAYFSDLDKDRTRRLTPRELAADYDPAHVVAGFRVPERSVDTRWVADRLVAALGAEPGVELRTGMRVAAVHRMQENGPMHVGFADGGREGPFDIVINALWEGRLAIDASLGLAVPAERNHRFRLSVFLRTDDAFDLPSTVVATGPFGDFKNYDNHTFYLSWYTAGLQVEGQGISPPPEPMLDAAGRDRVAQRILHRLEEIIPGVGRLAGAGGQAVVEGGWVYASGSGSLADRHASLHRRHLLGVCRSGGYFSVDTGKYSVAPWLADAITREVCDG